MSVGTNDIERAGMDGPSMPAEGEPQTEAEGFARTSEDESAGQSAVETEVPAGAAHGPVEHGPLAEVVVETGASGEAVAGPVAESAPGSTTRVGPVEVLVLPEEEPLASLGPRLPSPAQIASALAMLALLSPAALGGMPVLPVIIDDERRRQQEGIEQQSESTVGIHHEASAAAASLTLSQQRLASATREIEGTTARRVTEDDVVNAAHLVSAGKGTIRQQQRFRSALRSVATDSVDLFILEQAEAEERARPSETDEPSDDDLEAWLASFE